MKKITLSVVALLWAVSASAQWDGSAASAWTAGDGSADSPWIIDSPEHLAWLSQQVAAGETFAGKYFSMTADIDMNGHVFPTIGLHDRGTNGGEPYNDSHHFLGTFDGGFHSIKNAVITDSHIPTAEMRENLGGSGVFASISTGAVVKSLIIDESVVVGQSEMTVVGAVVGIMDGGLVENCANYAPVSGYFYLGGIVGTQEGGTVTGCANFGAVTGQTELGGIVGQQAEKAVVMSCYNRGTVTAAGFNAGGIVGAAYVSTRIANCYNAGNASSLPSSYMGNPDGIVSGKDSGCSVADCYNVAALAAVTTKYGVSVEAADLTPEKLNANSTATGLSLFTEAPDGLNGGLPVLAWQADMHLGVADAVMHPAADCCWYSLDGRRLDRKPVAPGIYIAVEGSASRKIAIR